MRFQETEVLDLGIVGKSLHHIRVVINGTDITAIMGQQYGNETLRLTQQDTTTTPEQERMLTKILCIVLCQWSTES